MRQKLLLLSLLLVTAGALLAGPPFHGTIFVAPDLITSSDPTDFIGLTPKGRGSRQMFDRRDRAGWIKKQAILFEARYRDGSTIEIQANPEFDEQSARVEASRFAPVIGRLPRCLRRDVKTVWLHRGMSDFGGGNENLLIYSDRAAEYIAKGILEETLFHEATHTSIDPRYKNDRKWKAAQKRDGNFISAYARDNPDREDLAESFVLYFAARHRPDRINALNRSKIESAIKQRLDYFDALKLDYSPAR